MEYNAIYQKKRIFEDSTIQKIFQSKMIKKLQNMKVFDVAMPLFYNIQAGLYKYKAKKNLPIPKSINDIKLKDE